MKCNVMFLALLFTAFLFPTVGSVSNADAQPGSRLCGISVGHMAILLEIKQPKGKKRRKGEERGKGEKRERKGRGGKRREKKRRGKREGGKRKGGEKGKQIINPIRNILRPLLK